MIDMNKQYTYNGKPVRIYADGSDTTGGVHCAVMNNTLLWEAMDISESDLVEVWQPKEEELCYFWDNMTNGSISVQKFISRTSNGHSFIGSSGLAYNNCAPFTGALPEAFKGL